MDNDDQRREYLIQAIRAAMQNVHRHTNAPFGAVIARDGKIIATAVNRCPNWIRLIDRVLLAAIFFAAYPDAHV